MELNIISHFLNQARLRPDGIALENKGGSVSFKEMETMIQAQAAYFEQKGVKKGSKVIILHHASIELFTAILALLGKGCSVVFVEEWSKVSDIADCCKTVQCDYIITNIKGKFIRLFYPVLSKLSVLNLKISHIPVSNEYKPELVDSETHAIISFSSGSSGAPKAVIRTHGILNAQFIALKNHIHFTEKSIMCTNFPVVILLNLGLGIKTLLGSGIRMSDLKKSNMDDLYNELKSGSVTHLAFSPYLLKNLADYCIQNKLQKLELTQILSGGSPVYPAHLKNIIEAFVCNDIEILYGSSEAEPIASCNALSILKNQHSPGIYAGKIDETSQCMIGTLNGSEFIRSQAFSIGEILVSGNHVVKQYLNSDTAFAKNKIIINSILWHRTGDYGYFNSNDELFLTGNPELTMSGVPILEVEKKLSEIEGVETGTIVRQIAYIQKTVNASRSEMIKKLKNMFPDLIDVQFMNLPLDRRHNGKIRYRLLK